MAKINPGDAIFILKDNAENTTEKKGTILYVDYIYHTVSVDYACCSCSKNMNIWKFPMPLSNDLEHRPDIKKLSTGIANATIAMVSGKRDDFDSLYGIYNSGEWGNYGWEPYIPNAKSLIKCECGQSKISGHEKDIWEFHSEYCAIYKEGKKNEKK